MTCNGFVVLTDGMQRPIFAGDSIKYLVEAIDEDKLPLQAVITAARFELKTFELGQPIALIPPLVKHIASGIEILPNSVVEVLLLPDDTQNLPAGTYLAILKIRSTDFGEMTYIRKLKLQDQLEEVDDP